jgi:hypothetical protein
MGKLGAEEYADGPLAHMMTSLFTPDSQVSDRTFTTYQIGARNMLVHLMSGDLRNFHYNPEFDEFMTEFMSRVLENTAKQGFQMPTRDRQHG